MSAYSHKRTWRGSGRNILIRIGLAHKMWTPQRGQAPPKSGREDMIGQLEAALRAERIAVHKIGPSWMLLMKPQGIANAGFT